MMEVQEAQVLQVLDGSSFVGSITCTTSEWLILTFASASNNLAVELNFTFTGAQANIAGRLEVEGGQEHGIIINTDSAASGRSYRGEYSFIFIDAGTHISTIAQAVYYIPASTPNYAVAGASGTGTDT